MEFEKRFWTRKNVILTRLRHSPHWGPDYTIIPPSWCLRAQEWTWIFVQQLYGIVAYCTYQKNVRLTLVFLLLANSLRFPKSWRGLIDFKRVSFIFVYSLWAWWRFGLSIRSYPGDTLLQTSLLSGRVIGINHPAIILQVLQFVSLLVHKERNRFCLVLFLNDSSNQRSQSTTTNVHFVHSACRHLQQQF